MLRKTKAINSLIIFTVNEPTFLLADSKNNAVIDQNMAVNNADNSPICD